MKNTKVNKLVYNTCMWTLLIAPLKQQNAFQLWEQLASFLFHITYVSTSIHMVIVTLVFKYGCEKNYYTYNNQNVTLYMSPTMN